LALVTCEECNRENVSSLAEACPGCGYPLAPQKAERQKITTNFRQIIWIVVGMVSLMILVKTGLFYEILEWLMNIVLQPTNK